jgi:glycerol-3-phosphate acyltransferase PlsX
MRVAVDAMGGDFAPDVNIDGAVDAVQEKDDLNVILVGDERSIKEGLKGRGYTESRISTLHASEVISMEASPSYAVRRKKDSSIRRAVELVRDGSSDAVVSAGNSGAMMALALFMLGTSEGVDRPAIATVMPSFKEPFLLLDAGANVDCNPLNLLQFGLMADAYCKHILQRPKPRIAILSIGEEPAKGNELTKEAYKLLANAPINFMGNIESKDAYMGEADGIVCDGFVGNIFLKTSEGLADLVMKMLKREISSSAAGKLGSMLFSPAFRNLEKVIDYDEYGGAPLLGINGSCIIGHGRAMPKAIKNAIITASDFSRKKVHEAVSAEIKSVHAGVKTLAAN